VKLNFLQRCVVFTGGVVLTCLLLVPVAAALFPVTANSVRDGGWRIEYWPPFICLCLADLAVAITLALVLKSNPPDGG